MWSPTLNAKPKSASVLESTKGWGMALIEKFFSILLRFFFPKKSYVRPWTDSDMENLWRNHT